MFDWDCYNGVCKDKNCENCYKKSSNSKCWVYCDICKRTISSSYFNKHIETRKHKYEIANKITGGLY